jgi:hypothetical protein
MSEKQNVAPLVRNNVDESKHKKYNIIIWKGKSEPTVISAPIPHFAH